MPGIRFTGLPSAGGANAARLLIGVLAAAGSGLVAAAGLPPTLQSDIGVWYAPDAPAVRDLWQPGDPGERLILRFRVLNTRAVPVSSARVELWHADSLGEVHAERFRTRLLTGDDGDLEVSTVLPGYIWGPRHIHVVVTHPDHPEFITRIFFKRDPVVAESGHPELAIFLEDGVAQGEPTLFGYVELVIP